MKPPMPHKPEMHFGNRMLGRDHSTLIVAEIGINHEGDKARCLELVEAAAKAGADAVKLQTADPDENYIPGTASYELFKSAFLGAEATAEVFACARALGVEVFTTTGMHTFDWIERLQPACYKISSSTLGHFPLVRRAARTGRPMIISTGMAEMEDVAASVAWARQYGANNLAILQCTSLYPCPLDKLDLGAIADIERRFDCVAGFSDHSKGYEAAALAVAAGARILEKHFSLDVTRPSYDHALSLDSDGFRVMVDKVRLAEVMLGADHKRLTPEAATVARNMKRYLVARRDIEIGDRLSADDIGVMRLAPNTTGMLPRFYDQILDARVIRRIPQWGPIRLEDLGITTEKGEA
ncbi:MAG: N-acetylneuraminate synthase family protein [Ferrovibrio sp.]|nr:N-acetylneuraminate synthase family protein [Ferrovibrio sp.]